MAKKKWMTVLAMMTTVSMLVGGCMTVPAAEESDPANVSAGISSIQKVEVNSGPSVTINNRNQNNDYSIDKQDVNTVNNSGDQISVIPMYRLYNPNSGEHFYTASVTEKNHLDRIGWNYEGIGWYAPTASHGIPVYRLYNKNGGEHHYTISAAERRNLLRIGWSNEGIGWYSYESSYNGTNRYPYSGAVPLYRQYNPNAFANNHNYTSSMRENNYLVSLGWRAEGIGWYGIDSGSNIAETQFIPLEYNTQYTSFDLDGDGKADRFFFNRENDSEGTSSLHLNSYPAQTFFSIRGWMLYYYRYDNANEFLIAVCGQFGGNRVDIYRWQNGKFEQTQTDIQFGEYDRKIPSGASGKTVYFACSEYHGDTEYTVPLTLNTSTHRFS